MISAEHREPSRASKVVEAQRRDQPAMKPLPRLEDDHRSYVVAARELSDRDLDVSPESNGSGKAVIGEVEERRLQVGSCLPGIPNAHLFKRLWMRSATCCAVNASPR